MSDGTTITSEEAVRRNMDSLDEYLKEKLGKQLYGEGEVHQAFTRSIELLIAGRTGDCGNAMRLWEMIRGAYNAGETHYPPQTPRDMGGRLLTFFHNVEEVKALRSFIIEHVKPILYAFMEDYSSGHHSVLSSAWWFGVKFNKRKAFTQLKPAAKKAGFSDDTLKTIIWFVDIGAGTMNTALKFLDSQKK